MRIRFYINYVRFVSNFSVLVTKIVYFMTFFSRNSREENNQDINFLNLGDMSYTKKLLENVMIIDGVEIYLPDYMYEIDPKDSFAKESNIIQPWDLGGLPIHCERSIHSFDWLYDLRAINSTISRKIAIAWILEWVARFGEGKGPGWSIEVASKRAISLVENGSLFDPPLFGGNEPYDFLNERIKRLLNRTFHFLRFLKPITFKTRDQFFLRTAIFHCEYFRGGNS